MADQNTQGSAGTAGAGGEFAIVLELAGVNPASGKGFGGPQVTKSGVYKVAVKGAERFIAQSGFDTCRFTVTLDGGEFDGYEQTVILPGKPDPEKDPTGAKFKARWKALMLNVASDPANLEKGKIQVGPRHLLGKSAFVYIRAYPEGTKDPKNPDYERRPDCNFMAPAEAQAEIAAEAKLAATRAGGQASAGQAPAQRAAAPAKSAEPDPLADI